MRSLAKCLNVEDFRCRAISRLPEPVFAFLEAGSEDEITFRRNREAFANWCLLPKPLVDVAHIDAGTTLLGQKLTWPFIVAPTGMPAFMHRDGDLGLAMAAQASGALFTLSTMATRSIEEVAEACPGPKAFQLYMFRDRGFTRELVQRAKSAGYAALMLTVDIQIPSNRERDKRSGMVLPPKLRPSTLFAMIQKPFWCINTLGGSMELANFRDQRSDSDVTLLQFIAQQFDPSVTWADLEWLAREWGGPLAVKGILRPEDAVRCLKSGATSVILSNHGGRQMDCVPSPMEVVEATIDAVAGTGEVIVDGGVRRGTDMLKAMALGASGCMAGRPGLYGLAAAGTPGATRVLQLLRAEFERDMALLGMPDIESISREGIIRLPDHDRKTMNESNG
jgi:L-lactate dehydrogenase (cytochrome)